MTHVRGGLLGTLTALLGCLLLAACGSGEDPEGPSTAPAPPAGKADQGSDQGPEEGKDASAEKPPNPLRGIDKGLAAQVGATLGSPQGCLWSTGELRSGSAWSTMKVPIALAVLDRTGGPQATSSAQRAQIESALTASDNDAALQLFDSLGSDGGGVQAAAAAVEDVLAAGGDRSTRVSTEGRDGFSPYGQTDWSLQEQARFLDSLAAGRVGSKQSRSYVLDLMTQVSSDPWGLGSLPGAAWKGGWGPDPSGKYLLRQMGYLEVGGQRVVVTIAVQPDDGSFEGGQPIATELAGRLRAAAKRSPGCESG